METCTGQEPLHRAGQPLDTRLLDFWRWSASDVLSNALRGVLAEYLVAVDLGVADGIRTEWDRYDLQTRRGITIEVKSAAYAQSWHQKRPSKITFGIAPTLGWDPETGESDTDRKRQAQVYVFCVLGKKDQPDVDPLDVSQWQFYVLATEILDRELGRRAEVDGCGYPNAVAARVG
jgi:hypothetical protein